MPHRGMASSLAAIALALAAMVLAAADTEASPQQHAAGRALRVAVTTLPADSPEEQIAQLQKDLKEERNRAQIADFALRPALENATAQALARKEAEVALADATVKVQSAEAALAEARKHAAELEARAEEDALKQRAETADVREKAALAREQSALVLAKNSTTQGDLVLEKEKLEEAREKLLEEEEKKAETEETASKAALAASSEELAAAKAELQKLQEEMQKTPEPSVIDKLKAFEYQLVLALVAGFIGVLSVVHPLRFAKTLTVGCVALLVGSAGMNKAAAALGPQLNIYAKFAVGAETAIIVAMAAVVGFEGFQLLLGAIFGMVLAFLVSDQGKVDVSNPDMGALWYGCFVFAGVLLLLFGREPACALLGPIIGGMMVASCTGFVAAEIIAPGNTAAWFDFVQAVAYGGGDAATVFGTNGPLARYIGLGIWVLFIVVGAVRYFVKRHRADKEESPLERPLMEGHSGRVEPARNDPAPSGGGWLKGPPKMKR